MFFATMKFLFSALTAAWLILPLGAELAKGTDFIRVEEDASVARLQTGVTQYRKGDVTVDLIGAIHIADAAYYKKLEEKFDDYDAVLFEMIADAESLPANRLPQQGEASEKKNLGALHQLYGMMAKLLGLTGQMDSIDYRRENFVHADITLTDFKRLQSEKGESVLDLATKAGQAPAKGQPDPSKLMQAMLSGNSNGMKLELIHTLGSGDDQIGALVGSNSVIIADRNIRCLEVLDEQVAAKHKRLAIFYGAAHFPDMERRLEERGYSKVSQDWLTAWHIPKPAKPEAATSSP
jgi:hypothetical protein